MSEKKYKLSDDTKKWCGHKLYRIIALRDFSLITGEEVKKGDKGGWIESEYNLFQAGRAWVKDGAIVYGNAEVVDNAVVKDCARVLGNAIIKDSAVVSDRAVINGYVRIEDNAKVKNNVLIRGSALIKDNAVVMGHSIIDDCAVIKDNAQVYGCACIDENAMVKDNAEVFDNAIVGGYAVISGNAKIYERAKVVGVADIGGNAKVYGRALIKYSNAIRRDIREDLIQYIAASLRVYPIKGKYYLYKRVNKVKEGVYKSIWDSDFIYKLGEYAEAKKVKEDFLISCDSGLHVSTADYWHEGDTLIAVEVDIKDIITCMEGKLRVRKLKVIDEIWSKK